MLREDVLLVIVYVHQHGWYYHATSHFEIHFLSATYRMDLMSAGSWRSGFTSPRPTATEQFHSVCPCALWHIIAQHRSSGNCSLQQCCVSCFCTVQLGKSPRAPAKRSRYTGTHWGWFGNGNILRPSFDWKPWKPGKRTTTVRRRMLACKRVTAICIVVQHTHDSTSGTVHQPCSNIQILDKSDVTPNGYAQNIRCILVHVWRKCRKTVNDLTVHCRRVVRSPANVQTFARIARLVHTPQLLPVLPCADTSEFSDLHPSACHSSAGRRSCLEAYVYSL